MQIMKYKTEMLKWRNRANITSLHKTEVSLPEIAHVFVLNHCFDANLHYGVEKSSRHATDVV